MGAQKENGLTLEALAQRLEALTETLGGLERENERMRSESEQMRSENAELRHKVTALEGSGPSGRDELAEKRGSHTRRSGEAALAFDGQVSRRSLLSKAGAAAVAAVAAGTLLNPRQAKAHTASNTIEAHSVIAHTVDAKPHSDTVPVRGEARGTLPALVGLQFGSGNAVLGNNLGGTGAGVTGSSTGNGNVGVHGQKPAGEGHGVLGEGRGSSFAGVQGRNQDGAGVWGQSSATGYEGLYGQHTGTSGYGVVGDGTGGSAGVLGRNPSGYGGRFEGGKAQLMLKPGTSPGKPLGYHAKGEIYMDSAGTLFVCTKGGTPARWRKFTTTAV